MKLRYANSLLMDLSNLWTCCKLHQKVSPEWSLNWETFVIINMGGWFGAGALRRRFPKVAPHIARLLKVVVLKLLIEKCDLKGWYWELFWFQQWCKLDANIDAEHLRNICQNEAQLMNKWTKRGCNIDAFSGKVILQRTWF